MNFIKKQNLVIQILIGMIAGLILSIIYLVLYNQNTTINGDIITYNSELLNNILQGSKIISIFGDVFIGSLKAIAPILVFFLIISALSKKQKSSSNSLIQIVFLYVLATFLAALVAVGMSFMFPTTLTWGVAADSSGAPTNLTSILGDTLESLIQNPVYAIATGNYLGILFWASLIGISLRRVGKELKKSIDQLADSLTHLIRWIIAFAPIGILGIIYDSLTSDGLKTVLSYGHLIFVLVGSMAIMMLIINPILIYIYIRKNPFPLIFTCLKTSGLAAFFTRSSAANIPVNIELCQELDVDEEIYSVSIPLGATINMTGAAITITVLTLAAAHTQGIVVTLPMAIVLSILAAFSACGASGVPGGSLLLLTTSTALFGIPPTIADKLLGVGYSISIIQDSCETALNSSSDAIYTATVDRRIKRIAKNKKDIN